MDYPDPLSTPYGETFELSTHLIANEVIRRGGQPRWLRNALFTAEVDGRPLAFNMTRCPITSTVAGELTTRKDYTRKVLESAGLPVAPGGVYRPDDHDRALQRARRVGWPVVVKPAGLGRGRGVTVGITCDDEFTAAWAAATKVTSGRILVERQADGEEARIVVVDGQAVAVCGRRRPNVVGDGETTIAGLIDRKQAERLENPHLSNKPLELTAARRGHLLSRGMSPDTVPEEGRTVWLEDRGGIVGAPSTWSHGADSVDMTDTVHPSYMTVAAAIQQAFPGSGLVGVDMIAEDWTRPAAAGNHIVVEVNCRPAIGCHHFPWEGKPRDVAGAIVDACLSH